MRLLVSLAVGLAISTVSVAASAYGDGATGYSGKQGQTCTGCHGGNAAKPTVTITGPDTLAAGATGDYTLTVTTNLTRAAANIAATDGATLVPGTGLQEGGGELTHTNGRPTAGGRYAFTFKVTAPATGGPLKLFAAGMGSNGTGTAGDGTTLSTKDVTVTGGAPAPAPPADPAPSQAGEDDDDAAATPAPTNTQSTTSDGTEKPSKKKKKKKVVEEEEEEDEDDYDRADPYAGRGGCSSTRGSFDASGATAAAMVLFAFGLVRRRRSPR
ncbi:MAG: hypothetical protein KIT84_02395 [Labilithrix sp.]|nr:hypothetical protein [Labilithrix sp.]MCW5809835.1 hypothetical protein [Labilithrix sp.]